MCHRMPRLVRAIAHCSPLMVLACVVGAGVVDEPPAPWRAEDHLPTLNIGDPAPPLNVDHWLKGEPIEAFEPGYVYVVEFWATWCSSCIVGFPDLSELQKEYADDVTVIAMTSADDRECTLESAAAMVADPERHMDFTVGFCNDATVYKAWVRAAGHRGIPTTLIVDRDGRIAYAGYLWRLEPTLEAIVAGTWDIGQRADLHRTAMLAGVLTRRFEELLEARDPGAFAFAREAIRGAVGEVAPSLCSMAEVTMYFTPYGLEPDLDLALDAARRAFAMNDDETDVWYFSVLAEAEFRSGNRDRAIELMEYVLEHSGDSPSTFFEGKLAEYRADDNVSGRTHVP